MLSKVKKRSKCTWPKQDARPKNRKKQNEDGKSRILDCTKHPDRSILALVCLHTTVYLYQNRRTSLKKARVSDFDLVRTPPGMPKVSISLRTSSKNQRFAHDAFKAEKTLQMHVAKATLTPKKAKKGKCWSHLPQSSKGQKP